ncbi:class I SAM-dependent methyltransferase [Thalassospira sp.]|uniref:class I SAM-dependent methyltransferase n=1 Tax=Thalassospira sp. TaxID=1912094 RepID=UPI0027354BF1|nr:class I SAM-dependent methyltransferase [Thalassospira sp.]MDP2698230.1 class I SAM-dependent methyltransferase [Thalassospira sp.]
MSLPDICPVCLSSQIRPFMQIEDQDYWRCIPCEATFLDPSCWLSQRDERAQYGLHENGNGDAGYRGFLSKLAIPLLKRLPAGQKGLDYGCGPGPVLADILRKAGHDMIHYDPCFFAHPPPFDQTFDFITCTEVAEHFHRPAVEFDRLDQMLRPGGILAVMTCFQNDDARFANWHYRRDPTHVVFYRSTTFDHLARIRGWICDFPARNIVLMTKKRN